MSDCWTVRLLGSALMIGRARGFSPVGRVTKASILVIAALAIVQWPVEAQKSRRVNRLIEMIEAGKPAFTGDSWIFVDREHRPYDVTELRQTLNTMLANKNAQGQPTLAPIVRVPTE